MSDHPYKVITYTLIFLIQKFQYHHIPYTNIGRVVEQINWAQIPGYYYIDTRSKWSL